MLWKISIEFIKLRFKTIRYNVNPKFTIIHKELKNLYLLNFNGYLLSRKEQQLSHFRMKWTLLMP